VPTDPRFGEMLDTSPQARRRYFELLRKMTPEQRAKVMSAATRRMRRMVEAGVRLQHPTADDDEVRVRVVIRLYGEEAARRIYRRLPDDPR
jgi:hypothetical protein